jgi:hypothetical protein
MARRWRRIFYELVPSWLSSGDGEKVLYSLGRVTDAFIERARQSLVARFPTYVGPTGLRMLGSERGIIQGREENLVGYARRLREWRGQYGHLTRGSPFAMLRQIWNYFGGVKVQEIDTGGNVYTMSRMGEESATHGGSWDWDGDSSWFRFWLKMVPDADSTIKAWGPLSSFPWGHTLEPGRGLTVGQMGVTPGDAKTVKNLFKGSRPWKLAGTKAEWLICVLGQDEDHAPDGTWENWTYNGAPSRPAAWRFWKL